MKKLTVKLIQLLIVSCITSWIFSSCSPKGETNQEKPQVSDQTAAPVEFEVSEDKAATSQYYALEHIKEWYPERVLPPAFDYSVDISKKSIVELWLLRNEIFARNGYLFEDAVLRGYFNQFKWYQPIFDVPDFKTQLNKDEQALVDKILRREKELLKGRYTRNGGVDMVSIDHVYNFIQFKAVGDNLKAALAKNNFAIVPAQNEQLFHVYDRNHYEYIPNFITTDLYLQVLHKHFSSVLQKVEEEKFIPLLTELFKRMYRESAQYAANEPQDAATFSRAYLAVAYSLITGQIQSGDYVVKEEFEKIVAAEGTGSELLRSDDFSYASFKPRGAYARSSELENYFRCVKWLDTAPINIDDDDGLRSAVLIAAFIRKEEQNLRDFNRYNEAIRFIVGEEDHMSISTMIKTLTDAEAQNPVGINLQTLRERLDKATVDRIRPKHGISRVEPKTILFTAGRYTFDAEILSRLTHVLRPEPKRPFPKALDVFASFGNKNAEKILLTEYNESKRWPAFTDSLNLLKNQFAGFDQWDQNIYSKTLEAILSLNSETYNYPLFMKTPAWSKKTLSTSLAAWSELKHDMLLHSEQPYSAQAAEGGGPPPPLHVSYVEPNINFWTKALELLEFQKEQLARMELLTDNTTMVIDELTEIGNLLLTVSKKQLANEKVTETEFDHLSYLGGQIEYLTFRIFNSDHLPKKERLVAVVADVYNSDGEYLEEAVGMVDEIYVIVEVNGKPCLAKGAAFSYYEFTSKTPLSDEDWQKQLTTGAPPERPSWMREIIVKTPSLESKPSYSF